MVIYCGLWRLIEIYGFSLLLICDLFVVYESNNYGICKIKNYMVVSWWFIAVYEDWLRFIVTHCYLFVICVWFMNPITMESVKTQKYCGFMVIYCGLWRLIEIYCYSLLLICGLFVVYESNNYGICKIKNYMVVSWWFIAVYEDWLRFIVIHCYLFVICLWFMNPITMESVKSQKYGDFMVFFFAGFPDSIG